MDLFLQAWGGLGYLLNKVFLSHAEDAGNERIKWRIRGWSVYLLGLPAWVIILLGEEDYITAAIEAGGGPAMILGLVAAWVGINRVPKRLKAIAEGCVYVFLTAGILYSLYEYRGITTLSQVLELGVTAGFLFGTYHLAQQRPSGWKWFMLMNVCMGTLMAIQLKPILALQQAISFGFDVRGYRRAKKQRVID